jgi:DNA helicase-2/ATP-dependent DNA helicase PcrA
LVDEFQDTNKKQLALLDKLVSGNELPNLFVVGDEDQCIYKFQGASHWNFEWMKRKFMDRLKTVVLNVNYRSTNLLVQETHNLICANSNRHILKKDPMIAGNDLATSIPVFAPTYKSFENAEQEAYSVAKSIKSQIDLGKRPSEIAVLVRRHSDTTAIKKWLIKLGISWTDNQNEKNLHETKYGKSLFYLLQFIRLQGKRGHFADSFLLQFLLLKQSPKHVIKSYLLYYGTQDKDFFQCLCSNPNELESFSTIKSGIITLLNSRDNKLSDDILHIINQVAEVGLSELPIPSEKNAWNKYIKDFCNNYKNTLQRLTEIMWYEYNYDIKTSIDTDEKIENENDIIITTIHASKGLEYEVVYLISCHQNNWENRDKKGGLKIPSPLDQFIAPEQDDYEDMRRLIYVACTRAKLELHVSSFRKYPAGGPLSTTTLLNNFGEKSQIQLENVENFELPDLSGEKYVLSPSSDLKDLVKSKLDSFQISSTSLNTWLVCQNQFFYTQVLKLSDINNQSGLFGTIVHNILQKYAEDENRQPTSAYLSNLIEQEFDKRDALFYPSHILWYKQFAMDLILNYLTKHPITTTPDYCEGNFTTILPTGVKLKGKIDRIDRAGNSLLVYDYKTSSTSKSLKPFEDINNPGEDYWRQAMIYTLLLNANFQNANQVNIAFHYLNDRLEQKKFEYNPNDSFLGWLSDIWGSIQNKEFTKNCNNPGCIYCSINL